MNRNRDDFPQSVKDTLAKRTGYFCSNPDCRKPTIGAQLGDDKTVNIGVASHIAAAAAGGPRYDSSMTSEERASVDNGIWLCANCSNLIDKDEQYYTVELLKKWKQQAETHSHHEISHSTVETRSQNTASSTNIFNLMLLEKDLTECLKWFSLFDMSSHIILDAENFPLPDDWSTLITNNSDFLGPVFALELYDICNNIISLKQLMQDEAERIRIQYPHNVHKWIVDEQVVFYHRRLKNIISRLSDSLTQDTINILAEKLNM